MNQPDTDTDTDAKTGVLSVKHSCPGGCGGFVHRPHFACHTCWARLPGVLRFPIELAFMAGDNDAQSRAMTDAMHWYRANPRVNPSSKENSQS